MRSKFKWTLALFMALIVQVSFAQEKTLSGVVTESGVPLPGATVIVKGTQHGTQTDLDGRYTLKVNPGDVLVFSFIGLTDLSYTVGVPNSYNASMSADEEMLDEVVVLAYGQVKNKNEVTGNVVTVKSDVIANTPLPTIDQALQGRVSGLQMSSSSGVPGAVQNIRIRGRNSLTATNEPLIVIDGIPVINSNFAGSTDESSLSALAALDSNDIESMTVLKDAGATAVYGARGTNGVILITTKKGKSGATKFELKTTLGFQNYAVKGPRMLTGAQKKELYLEGVYNTFGVANGFGRDEAYAFTEANASGLAGGTSLVNWVKGGEVETNWGDLVKKKDAPVSTVSFSASGGDESSSFYASLGHNKTEGTVIGSDFRRISGVFSFNKKLSDKFDFNTNINVSNVKQNGLLEGAAYFSNPNLTKLFMSPWIPAYNADGTYNLPRSGLHNILYTTENNITTNDLTRVLNSNVVSYKITDNLKFTSSIALDYALAAYKSYKNPVHGDGDGIGGYVVNSINRNFNYVAQNSLDYRFYVGEGHRFDVKLVYEFQKNKSHLLEGEGQAVASGFTSLGTTADNHFASANFTDWMQQGYVGLLSYNYQNRYLIDLTGRREGSSRFSEGSQWGNFFSVGAAWNISEEEFLSNQETLSLLRLRGSYGTNGNSTISPNQYQQLLKFEIYDHEGGLVPSQLGGPLSWEKQKKMDVGLEFGFLDNRISGSFAYYKSMTDDLIYAKPLSYTSGYATQYVNLGALENSGFEVDLNFDIVRSKDFNLSLGGNIGTVKNKITEMPLGPDGKPLEVLGSYSANVEGKAIGEWYMPTYAGVDVQTGEALWFKKDGGTTNAYGQAEKRFQGASALPTYSGGVNLHVDYKGFFINSLVAFSGGNKVYEDWVAQTNGSGATTTATYNGVEKLMDRWQNPGDVTDVPKTVNRNTANSSQSTSPSTRFLYDGDYIRLRDVSFGYNFRGAILRTLSLDGLTLSVIGTNLLTKVKDDRLKYDPEIDPTGFTSLTAPPIKSVVFSLNIKF
ncbi:SusC/RagA family TonB-linked outer membrane protein [Myroides guanonis]|uniref:TonB-linked outer membrane protein, SusC/RagA family n=1 Tax=Myroides guanonis TaxID=1150112 RepID=A0A1I3MCX5_9FLAO|nr:SusC/RagA family TonB-linked outer membrane protein [Myroides guanonis]SFI94640.1 TonB-linked outer membrane protein, SusC/RagA family [Myroides guanonis]